MREVLDRTALDKYGKVYSDLDEYDKAVVNVAARKDPSEGGHELMVDPHTGKIVFHLYGNSNQTGSTVCGEYFVGDGVNKDIVCRSAY